MKIFIRCIFLLLLPSVPKCPVSSWHRGMGKNEFPKSKTWTELEEKINRAYKIFYYNSAVYEYRNNKNYESAYEYCIKGLEVETKSKDLDRDLKELKKKCEFWL